MTQNVLDYSQNPSGNELMDTYLAGMAQNQLTNHSGVTRPSYAVAGTFWIDTSTTPWVLKQFTGSADISIGTLNQSTLVFTASRALGDKNGNDITTTYLGANSTAVRAIGDKNGNDITTTYLGVNATAVRATGDVDGNAIKTTYAKLGSANTFTGNNTFSGSVGLGSSATATTPSVTNNSTKIATTAYVSSKFQYVTELPASPTSGVLYFVKES